MELIKTTVTKILWANNALHKTVIVIKPDEGQTVTSEIIDDPDNRKWNNNQTTKVSLYELDNGVLVERKWISTRPGEFVENIIGHKEAVALSDEAPELLKDIPGWATWSMSEVVSYIEDNVTDLASAKQVLIALAKVVVVLRNYALSEVVTGHD